MVLFLFRRVTHTNTLYVALSVSLCLPHAVTFSAFMICCDLCAFVIMLAICVLLTYHNQLFYTIKIVGDTKAMLPV